jgi:hypothetical protein
MDLSLALRDRLPRMDAQLAHGRVDQYRCQVTCDTTATLSDEDARLVDEVIAPDAPGLRYDALRRRAAKLALRLDPDSDRERKQRATRKKARVEKFLERSGNYAYAGRELPIDQVLASEAHIRGLAQHLRACGIPGSLRELELMIYLDLTQGRDPRDRITGSHGAESDRARSTGMVDPHGPAGQPSCHDWRAEGDCAGADWSARDCDDECDAEDVDGNGVDTDGEDTDGGSVENDGNGWNGDGGGGPRPFSPPSPGKPGGRAAFPAKINLLVPAGTAYGWSTMPGEAGREVIDPTTLREMVQAASLHRDTRWNVTLIREDGTAVAHARAHGQHTWNPPPDAASARPGNRARQGPGEGHLTDHPDEVAATPTGHSQDETPTSAQLEQLQQFLRRLKVAFEPIVKGECDHRQAEPRYRPSPKLQDRVRARNASCPAPGCDASSAHSDLDHTEHWPHGPTCECNFGVPCRHHHRTKQAPGWKLEQPEPGVFTWTTPSGHVYNTGPTSYDA